VNLNIIFSLKNIIFFGHDSNISLTGGKLLIFVVKNNMSVFSVCRNSQREKTRNATVSF